jgi:hypothetical protein
MDKNTQSSMRALVNGPVTVSFWWKVSSETNHDVLAFLVGGVPQTAISGEVDWQQVTVSVPAGPQMLIWTYSKDGSGSAGQDAGWVDQLVITAVAPSIVIQPASKGVLGGTNVTLSVLATGTPPLAYQWLKFGSNFSGATFNSLTFNNVTRSNSGFYSVVITNIAGSITSSNAQLRVFVPQRFSTPVLQANGAILFFSRDADGGSLSPADLPNFTAQASSNLFDWITLPSALSITNGGLLLQDPDQPSFPFRFYRIVEQ